MLMLNNDTSNAWITVLASWLGVIRYCRVESENPTKPIDQKSSKSADYVNKHGEEHTTKHSKFLNIFDLLYVPFP